MSFRNLYSQVPYAVVELFPVPLCCSQVPYTVVELFPVPLWFHIL
jgi:hypothetical protein